MKARWIQKTRKNEMGQSLVEFALVVPILLLLVIGIAEFGRAWMSKNILTGAAREAVRVAVVDPSRTRATPRATQVLTSAGITGATVTIIDDGLSGGQISVRVDYNFPVTIAGFIPGLSNVTFPLSSTTTMRREY